MWNRRADKDMHARVAALEARVRELEDERAIREVLARYGFTADTCRDEAYVDLYTDDGAIDLVIADQQMYPGVVRFEGKDELRRFIADPGAHHRPGFYGRSMHLMGNNVAMRVEGDRAVANSYSMTMQADPEQVVDILSVANNQWQLERVDGRWLIKERRRREIGSEEYRTNVDALAE